MAASVVESNWRPENREKVTLRFTIHNAIQMCQVAGKSLQSLPMQAFGAKWTIKVCFTDSGNTLLNLRLDPRFGGSQQLSDYSFQVRVVNVDGSLTRKCAAQTGSGHTADTKAIKTAELLSARGGFLHQSQGFLHQYRVIFDVDLYSTKGSAEQGSGTAQCISGTAPAVPASTLVRDHAALLEVTQRYPSAQNPSLSTHFCSTPQSGDLSDITFTVGGTDFPAHRVILSARSEVFRAMFKAGGVEATTGQISIPDIDPVAFKQLLRFIYTDEVEAGAMEAMADHLYIASTKYQLERLQVMSGLYLSKTLSTTNAVERLLLAETNSAALVKQEAMRFIAAHMAEIRTTEAYRKLREHPDLLMDLLDMAAGLAPAGAEGSKVGQKRPRE